MSFLFGKARNIRAVGRVKLNCRVCGYEHPAERLIEVSYFTVFTLPVLPLERIRDYTECTGCGESYASESATEPAAHATVRGVLAYVMLGFGGTSRLASAGEIFRRTTGVPVDYEELNAAVRQIEQGDFAIFEFLRKSAYHLNLKGKEQVIEAAYLMTHACCEIQQQDRMRVSLMGGALGLGSSQVDAVIERVRAARYYGVRRHLTRVSSVPR